LKKQLLIRYITKSISYEEPLTNAGQNITEGNVEEVFLTTELGSGEEHFDADGSSNRLSKRSGDDYKVFRIGELLDVKKRLRTYNTKMETSDTLLDEWYNFLLGHAPLELNTATPYETVDGKWKLYGNEDLDEKWFELVEGTRVRFERDSTPFDETKMAKWSGTLAARLWLGWNYAPTDEGYNGRDRMTVDPHNPCIV